MAPGIPTYGPVASLGVCPIVKYKGMARAAPEEYNVVRGAGIQPPPPSIGKICVHLYIWRGDGVHWQAPSLVYLSLDPYHAQFYFASALVGDLFEEAVSLLIVALSPER